MDNKKSILLILLIINVNIYSQQHEYEIGLRLTPAPPSMSVLAGVTFAIDFLIDNSSQSFLTSVNYDVGTFANSDFLGSIKDNSLQLFSVEGTLKFKMTKEHSPWYSGFGLGYYRFTEISHVGNSPVQHPYTVVKGKVNYTSHIGFNSLFGKQFALSDVVAINVAVKSFIIPLWQKTEITYQKLDGELENSTKEVFRIIPSVFITFALVIKE